MGEQPAASRKINTVTPIMSDQRMLQHLMQEMSVETKENELKLKAMLDKYQQEVTGVVRGGPDMQSQQPGMLPPPAWTPRMDINQLHAPPPMVSSMTCGGSPLAPSSSPLHSVSSHSQPCLASTAVDLKDPAAGSSWTSGTALEKRRLAYTRGRSTEQSCLTGAGGYEVTSVLPPGYPAAAPPVSSASGSMLGPQVPSGSIMAPPPPAPPPSALVAPSPQYHQYVPMGASASNSLQQAVQAMRQENIFLRAEVDRLTAKANTLQRLESEHGAIEAEYDALLREKERMEEMEKHALAAYETRIKVVEQDRDSLREQLAQAQTAHHLMTAAAAKIEEYNKLSNFVALLSRQKDDLSLVAEQQRREIGSQTTTLEEQRKHIAVLETALGKAQERVQMSDKIIEDFRSEQRLKDTCNNGNGYNGGGVVRRSSSKNSSPSNTASSEGGNNELIAMLGWQLKSRDDMILKLEATLSDYQKRAEEADRIKETMTHTFNLQILALQQEKYDRDRKIAELTEVNVRLLAEFQFDGSDPGGQDDDSRGRTRDLNRMEEVRQRIQEKKKRVNRPQTKNKRSLTSWSSSTQLTPTTSTAESLPCLSTAIPTVTHHSRPAPPPPLDFTTSTAATVIPSVSYTYAPPHSANNYTAAEYSNSRGITTTTTTVISNGNTVILKEADL